MTQPKKFLGLTMPMLLLAGMAFATVGNLNSCSDLPAVVYKNTGAAYVGISMKNDTAVDQLSWNLHFGNLVEWTNTCAAGLAQFAPEVATHGCATSASVGMDGHLTVTINSCTTPLPSRTSTSGLFSACYRAIPNTHVTGLDGLTGTCTAINNSSGALNCQYSFKSTSVTEVIHVTNIPAEVVRNSGQVRVGELRVGTDTELVWTSWNISNSGGDHIKFLDTTNQACCAALTGSSIGCPHSAANKKIVLPLQDLTGCLLEQHWLHVGDQFDGRVTCDDGMDFLGTTIQPLLKFCYQGIGDGIELIDSTCGAVAESGGRECLFNQLQVVVTP